MDPHEEKSRAALRARAEEAMEAAVAAASARAPASDGLVETAIAAVRLACWDRGLEPRARLLLIGEALELLGALKELPSAPAAARPELVLALYRRTNGLLRRYAALVGARK